MLPTPSYYLIRFSKYLGSGILIYIYLKAACHVHPVKKATHFLENAGSKEILSQSYWKFVWFYSRYLAECGFFFSRATIGSDDIEFQ
jgi:hypothetical protein